MSVKPSSAHKQTKVEQSIQTRALFIRVARQLFAQQGYASTSTEQILAQTNVTRGALYHQFKNKADLLRAVCEQIQAEIYQEILLAAKGATDSFQALLLGCDAFLDAAAKSDVRRILLLDAPAALGWEEWNRIDREHGFGLLVEGMKQAIADGHFKTQSAEALATMINGAMNEGVVWAVQSGDVTARLVEVRIVLHQLLMGVKSLAAE
jgi:AcrR family transcriptional regulator